MIVGRPVEYAGARADPVLARQRYDRMLEGFGIALHYVYEPLGAAYSYASRLAEPATVLVADFGGGTTDFSIVRVAEPGAARRCVPLASAGVGIAGGPVRPAHRRPAGAAAAGKGRQLSLVR